MCLTDTSGKGQSQGREADDINLRVDRRGVDGSVPQHYRDFVDGFLLVDRSGRQDMAEKVSPIGRRVGSRDFQVPREEIAGPAAVIQGPLGARWRRKTWGTPRGGRPHNR